MTARELIAQATGRLTPFEYDSVRYLLRPLTQAELLSLPDNGREAMNRVFGLVVVGDGGAALFTPDEVPLMPEAAVQAVADEAFRRCRPEGKAEPAKTTA